VEVVTWPLDLTEVEVNIAIAKAWRDHGPTICSSTVLELHTKLLLQSQPECAARARINLVGMYVTRLVARRMAAQREGRIVNVSSLMGKVAVRRWLPIRHQVCDGFTKLARRTSSAHSGDGFLPSLTDTDMVRELQWFRLVPMTPSKWQAFIAGLHKDHLKSWWGGSFSGATYFIPRLEKVLLMAAPLSRNRQKYYQRFRHSNVTLEL